MNGVGFRSVNSFDTLALDFGYSNIIIFKNNKDINIKFSKRKIILMSSNLIKLGNFAFLMRKLKNVNAYKKKGLLFKNENLKLKKGKIRV